MVDWAEEDYWKGRLDRSLTMDNRFGIADTAK